MSRFIWWIRCGLTVAGVTCVLAWQSPAWAGGKVSLWQSRDQFVTLEPQDPAADGVAPANDHPLELSAEQLSYLLGAIDLRSAKNEASEPLFTAKMLQLLAPYLQKGLSQAAPGQDVTFAVIGFHETLYGLGKQPKVTTGRLFSQGGKLCLIVGIAQQDVDDRDDRRLKPFTPGARRKPVTSGAWTLVPHGGQQVFTQKRADWVEFGKESLAAPVPPPVAERKPTASQPFLDIPQGRAVERSPADRLTTLNDLKNKGLISDEEYRAKRLEILNGL